MPSVTPTMTLPPTPRRLSLPSPSARALPRAAPLRRPAPMGRSASPSPARRRASPDRARVHRRAASRGQDLDRAADLDPARSSASLADWGDRAAAACEDGDPDVELCDLPEVLAAPRLPGLDRSAAAEALSRGRWLLGLLVLQSSSSFILDAYQDLIREHLVVTLFLTMLVGAGGNAGNQSAWWEGVEETDTTCLFCTKHTISPN